MKKLILMLLSALLLGSLLAGCGGRTGTETAGVGKKTFVFGDTTFNAENEEPNVNPHEAYAGWACIRYGVGETLFRFNDTMELEPWIAESAEAVDDLTWKVTLKEGVCFSNGRSVDAQAVQECFEHLISVHQRAQGDLGIASMESDGLVLTIHTQQPKPTLMNYLCDPYGCIIDMDSGITDDGIVVGTGPYVAVEVVTDDHVKLVKNENYWDGAVSIDEITVRTISDGDTLAMALQAGEIDAAYGMAYGSYPLFENDGYTFTNTPTSRVFYCQMNFASQLIQDDAVRKAVAMGIDKESFVNTLLSGYGYVGTGAFPDTFPYGGSNVTTEHYDPEGAKAVLEAAGWVDSDGDGIREKDGVKLSLKWLSYPSRQEQPLLAEAAQATLKEIGIELILNVTADHNSIVKDPDAWDIYQAAFVTCGTGDPMYFFTTHCLSNSTKNRGGYYNETLEQLASEMSQTFDADRRSELAIAMQQEILDDNAFIFCSFLRMSMISKSTVTGLKAWPSDYYELTADLDIIQ